MLVLALGKNGSQCADQAEQAGLSAPGDSRHIRWMVDGALEAKSRLNQVGPLLTCMAVFCMKNDVRDRLVKAPFPRAEIGSAHVNNGAATFVHPNLLRDPYRGGDAEV